MLIAVPGPHEEFFNSAFGIWLDGKQFSGGCCRPISMHEVWRSLGLSHNILEQLSTLRHEAAMRRARVLPGKNYMAALIQALK